MIPFWTTLYSVSSTRGILNPLNNRNPTFIAFLRSSPTQRIKRKPSSTSHSDSTAGSHTHEDVNSVANNAEFSQAIILHVTWSPDLKGEQNPQDGHEKLA